MRNLNAIQFAAASLALISGGGSPRLRTPREEKYPGQSTAFLQGAWRGGGVPPDPKRSKGRICRQS
jgi:hypothetical protein